MDEQLQQPLTKHERRMEARREHGARQFSSEKRKKIQSALIWVAIFLAIVGIIYWMVAASSSSNTKTGSGVAAVTSKDWVAGKSTAQVTLIEYGDFQCPACGAYYPLVEGIRDANKDTLRTVFREYPLISAHPNAQAAAQAAEAAGMQGKFWEMYTKLYSEQSAWSGAPDPQINFANYAQNINLNVDQWKKDQKSSAVKEKIAADVASGNAAGVDGTPSFFVNGERVTNPNSQADFQKIIDDAVKKSPAANPDSIANTAN